MLPYPQPGGAVPCRGENFLLLWREKESIIVENENFGIYRVRGTRRKMMDVPFCGGAAPAP